jgi:hypothetical protein
MLFACLIIYINLLNKLRTRGGHGTLGHCVHLFIATYFLPKIIILIYLLVTAFSSTLFGQGSLRIKYRGYNSQRFASLL